MPSRVYPLRSFYTIMSGIVFEILFDLKHVLYNICQDFVKFAIVSIGLLHSSLVIDLRSVLYTIRRFGVYIMKGVVHVMLDLFLNSAEQHHDAIYYSALESIFVGIYSWICVLSPQRCLHAFGSIVQVLDAILEELYMAMVKLWCIANLFYHAVERDMVGIYLGNLASHWSQHLDEDFFKHILLYIVIWLIFFGIGKVIQITI